MYAKFCVTARHDYYIRHDGNCRNKVHLLSRKPISGFQRPFGQALRLKLKVVQTLRLGLMI